MFCLCLLSILYIFFFVQLKNINFHICSNLMVFLGYCGSDVIYNFSISRNTYSSTHYFPREVVTQYSKEMLHLANRLLSIISQSLTLPPSYLEDAVGDVYQNITVSFYPSCPRPDLALGLQAHSDMGAITLLIQDDVGGLEVLKDDKWVLVQPLTEAIVVILADMTEVLWLLLLGLICKRTAALFINFKDQ